MKGRGPSFEQTWITFTQGCIVLGFVEIDPVVREKEKKMWKFYVNNNDDNNDDEQRTNYDQKGTLKPSARRA